MDPASLLQTATAGIAVVQLAHRTYLFVREVANARSEAQLLSQKIRRLFRLARAVYSRLHLREQLRDAKPPPPEEAEIEEIVRENFEAVRRSLLSINRKLRGLGNNEQFDFAVTIYNSFHYALSATNIRKQETAAETSIQTLSTALHLLQLLEHNTTQKRIEELAKAVNNAVAHLQSLPPTMISPHLPVPPYTQSAIDSAEISVDPDADLLGIASLRKTIEVAKSVRSTYGSVSNRDKRSMAEMEAICSSDDSDLDEGLDAASPDPSIPQTIQPEPGCRRFSTESQPDFVMSVEDDIRGKHWPPRIVTKTKQKYKKYAIRESGRGNYGTAEQHLRSAFDRGVSLEDGGYECFVDKAEIRQQLTDIYIKQSKYGEAVRELHCLLQEFDSAQTPEQTLERAMLYKTLAQIHHSMFLSNNEQGNRDAAEKHIHLAEIYAIERSFTDLDELCDSESGIVTRRCSDFVHCVELIIKILEDQGKTVESEAWREEILGTTSPLDQPWEFIDQVDGQELEDSREAELRKLHTPGRTPLINAIVFNLPDHFQNILNELHESGGSIDGRCEQGLTPIMHAVACQHEKGCGCEKAIEKLVHHGADINNTTGAHKETALHQAAAAGNEKMVSLLLSKEADKDASAPHTPLLVAVKSNQNRVVDILLDQGADPNLLNADKWSMLHHAVNSNAIDTLITLLSSKHKDKIDVEAKSSTGRTALLLTAERAAKPKNYALAEVLLRKRADANATDLCGRSALYFATNGPRNSERENFVRLLLKYGAEPALTLPKFRTRFGQYIALRQANNQLKRTDSEASGVRRTSVVGRMDSASTARRDSGTSTASSVITGMTVESSPSPRAGILGLKFGRRSGG